jgi:hypothetical protein
VTRPAPRILIRKDPTDEANPWYYQVEHNPPAADAMDYGSLESMPRALEAACFALANPQLFDPRPAD